MNYKEVWEQNAVLRGMPVPSFAAHARRMAAEIAARDRSPDTPQTTDVVLHNAPTNSGPHAKPR